MKDRYTVGKNRQGDNDQIIKPGLGYLLGLVKNNSNLKYLQQIIGFGI